MAQQDDPYADFLRELDSGVNGYKEAVPWADAESLRTNLAFIRATEVLSSSEGSRKQYGLPRSQYTVIRLLYFAANNRQPQIDLARAMGVAPTYVTRLIDALERRGWVDRYISAEDRRITYAHLTDAGREACSELVPKAVEFMAAWIKDFDSEEKQKLQYLLSKLAMGIANAQKELGRSDEEQAADDEDG